MTQANTNSASNPHASVPELIAQVEQEIARLDPASKHYRSFKNQHESHLRLLRESMAEHAPPARRSVSRPTFRWKNVLLLVVCALLLGAGQFAFKRYFP